MLLPEYHSNDIDNCFVLFPICPIRLYILTGFDRPLLPIEMGNFLKQVPFENLQIRVKTTSKRFLFFSFLEIMTLACVHVICPLARMESP